MLYTLHFYSKIPKSLFKILLIQSYYMYSAFYTHVPAVMLQAAVQDSTIFPLGITELCDDRHGFAKSTQLLASFCESMSGYAKLLNPKGKLWIVGLLVGGLRLPSCKVEHNSCFHACQLQTYYVNYNENSTESALFLLKTLKLFRFEFLCSKIVV